MRNCITIAAIFLLLTTVAGAQTKTDTSVSRKNSISISINGILTELFSNSGYSPDILTYRHHFGRRSALRVGLSGHILTSNGIENDTNALEISYKRFAFRAGWEINAIHYNKWCMYMGIDAVVNGEKDHFAREYSSASYMIDDRTIYGCGVSPVFGLIYNLNPMIDFGAESSLDVLYMNVSSAQTTGYSNGVTETMNSYSHQFRTEYNSPIGLMLRISF